MGDTDAAAMARMTAEVEEEEVDVMELVRRLQEDRSEGMRDEPGTELFRNYNYSNKFCQALELQPLPPKLMRRGLRRW